MEEDEDSKNCEEIFEMEQDAYQLRPGQKPVQKKRERKNNSL